ATRGAGGRDAKCRTAPDGDAAGARAEGCRHDVRARRPPERHTVERPAELSRPHGAIRATANRLRRPGTRLRRDSKPLDQLRRGTQGAHRVVRRAAGGTRSGAVRQRGLRRGSVREVALPAPVNFVLVAWLITQGIAPLRKSDLVRLLSGSVMSQEEMAQ